MKKQVTALPFAVVFFVMCIVFFAWLRFDKSRILIVTSKTRLGAASIASEIKDLLNKRHNFSVKTYSLEGETMPERSIELNTIKINKLVREFHPNTIVAVNPIAQNIIRESYLDSPHIKLIFAGNNSPENKEAIFNMNNVTGMVTSTPFVMIKNFLTDIHFKGRKIYVLGNNSAVNEQLLIALKKADFKPYELVSPFLTKELSEWKKFLEQANHEADLLLLLDYSGLIDYEDGSKGKVPVLTKNVTKYLLENSGIPMIGINRDFAKQKGPIAFTPYYQNSAKVIVWLTTHFINQNDKSESIPLVVQDIVSPEINIAAFKRFFPGYTIPDIYKSYAKAINRYYRGDKYDFIGEVQSIDTEKQAITGEADKSKLDN